MVPQSSRLHGGGDNNGTDNAIRPMMQRTTNRGKIAAKRR